MAGGYSSSNFVDFKKKGWRARFVHAWKFFWSLLFSPFRWLFHAVVFVAKLAYLGWKHRKVKHLFFGLPSLIIVGFVIYVCLAVVQASPATLGKRYLEAGRSALGSESWPAASLYLSRAVDLGVRDNETLFSIARAAQKSSDISRMESILESLAPADRPGYAPAHLWKANQILAGKVVGKVEAAEAEQQLEYVLQLDPSNPAAHGILGDLYFQAGLWKSAVEHLRQAGSLSFRSKLMLAKASSAAGSVEQARAYAEDVCDAAAAAVTAEPAGKENRLALGEGLLLLERYEEAAKVLQEGMTLHDDPEYHQSLGLVLMHWSDAMLRDSSDQRPQAFQLLAVAIEQNPNEMLLFDRMLALLRTNDETATAARDFLTENIVAGRSAGVSHLILGTDLYLDDKVNEAGAHLEQAFRLIPNGLVVANNYAWFLLHGDPPDTERSLQIIDSVIARDPDLAEFHDTKGHILLARNDWQGAISEFERALAGMVPRAETHFALATAYEKIGLPDIAVKHKQLAENLKSSAER